MGLPWLWSLKERWCEVEGIVASASGRGGWKEGGPPGAKTRGGYLEPGWEDGTPHPARAHGALACVPLHCWPG